MPTTTTTTTTTTTAGGIARTVTVTTTVTTPAAAAAATVNSAEDFPRTVGDVTVEWLSALLGKEVASFETQVLDMGVLSDLGRLTLTYADEKGPEAIIVKVAKGIDSSRAQPSSSPKLHSTLRPTHGREHPVLKKGKNCYTSARHLSRAQAADATD